MISIQTTGQLGDALRAARKQLGLTQPQLALAAGVGVRFIVDLEAGKATLRLENVLPDGMPQGSENLIVMHNGDAAPPAL